MKAWPLLMPILVALTGCGQAGFPPPPGYPAVEVGSRLAANLDEACVADYRPDVDYFPEKTAFTHSSQLSVSYGLNYKHVTLRPAVGRREVLEYLFVQCGTPAPPHGRNAVVVEVPVARIATDHTVIMGALAELDMVDRLIGVANSRWVTVPAIRERIRQGLVREMASDVHHSIEPILAAQADVWLGFYWAYPEYDMHPTLRELGVRTVSQADQLESHPLGAAEWLKLLAMLVNREALANARFEGIVARYEAVAQIARQARTRPLVMFGNAVGRDEFDLVGGQNAFARLIEDAGGRYVMADDTFTGTWLRLPWERVYAAGATAPVWVGGPQGKTTVAGMIAGNPRYAWFEAVRNKRVYTYDLGYRGDWAYPFFDTGLTRPDVTLRETLYAIHPELFSTPPEAQYVRHLQ